MLPNGRALFSGNSALFWDLTAVGMLSSTTPAGQKFYGHPEPGAEGHVVRGHTCGGTRTNNS